MKKFTIILFSLILCIFISGCNSNTSGGFKTITYDEYKNLIANKESFILEISREDCTYCESFKPKLQSVIKEYGVDVKVINLSKLQTDEYDTFTKEIGTTATPTVIFYKEGYEASVATRINGDVTRDKIIEKMKDNGFIK